MQLIWCSASEVHCKSVNATSGFCRELWSIRTVWVPGCSALGSSLSRSQGPERTGGARRRCVSRVVRQIGARRG